MGSIGAGTQITKVVKGNFNIDPLDDTGGSSSGQQSSTTAAQDISGTYSPYTINTNDTIYILQLNKQQQIQEYRVIFVYIFHF